MTINPSQDPCKETFVNRQKRQRKGKVTASPKAKVKVKARARGSFCTTGVSTILSVNFDSIPCLLLCWHLHQSWDFLHSVEELNMWRFLCFLRGLSWCEIGDASQFVNVRTCLCAVREELRLFRAPSAHASTALDESPRLSRKFGLLEPASVPPRAIDDMPVKCSSRILKSGEFLFVCLITCLASLLDGRILSLCTFILMVLNSTVSSTCLVTWQKGRALGCFLCIVILKILGCFTSTELTVGWTPVFTTFSTIHCWIMS